LIYTVPTTDTKVLVFYTFYNVRVIYIKILSLQKQLVALKEYEKSIDALYRKVKLLAQEGKKAEVDILKIDYERHKLDATIEEISNRIFLPT